MEHKTPLHSATTGLRAQTQTLRGISSIETGSEWYPPAMPQNQHQGTSESQVRLGGRLGACPRPLLSESDSRL